MGLSPPFRGLAKLSHPLHHAGSVQERIAERHQPMTGNRIARTLVAVFFVALLAAPLVLKRMAARREADKSTADTQTVLARHGFYFQEVSHAAGINFVHRSPTLDHQLDHIMPQVASMGAAVSIVDFDRDGWPDIYVTNSA